MTAQPPVNEPHQAEQESPRRRVAVKVVRPAG